MQFLRRMAGKPYGPGAAEMAATMSFTVNSRSLMLVCFAGLSLPYGLGVLKTFLYCEERSSAISLLSFVRVRPLFKGRIFVFDLGFFLA